MGCGASQPADPLDGKTPLATRGKSSSVAPLTVAPKAPEDDNPFLDPSPGVNEHTKAKSKPAPAALPIALPDPTPAPAPAPETTTSPITPLTGRRSSHRRSSEAEASEDEDEDDVPTDIPAKPKTPRSASQRSIAGSSARQMKEVEEMKVNDDDEAVSPRGEGATTPSAKPSGHARSQSFTELLAVQPPSMVLSDPLRLTTLLPTTFLHYAKKQYDTSPRAAATGEDDEEEKLDKKAIGQLAYDCVLSFVAALKKDPALSKLKEAQRKKEEDFLRRKLIPGDSVDECIDTAVAYLKAELIYKNGCISKTCFFFHFPRAYRGLFVYEKMTLEREGMVSKWNKICRETAAKAAKDAAKEAEADRAAGDDTKGDKKKDKKDKKSKKKKDRKTAPSSGGDLFANMAGHGSKLLQAEKKMKSAAKAGSTRNLMKDVPKDEDE